MDNNEKAILKTLIYSDIFDYPLTKEELWYYAIFHKSLDKKSFFSSLNSRSFFQKNYQYYFLPGQEHIVESRLKRERIAKKKMIIAQHVCAILSYIFAIKFIGISGSLAMENTEEKDDIDLFIITKSNTIWITRFCIFIILEILGKRRKKFAKEVSNKVCVNLFIEESCLAFPPARQNVYTAHEIAQVKPMFNRNSTYEDFLLANIWVATYMPNAIDFTSLRGVYDSDAAISSSNGIASHQPARQAPVRGLIRNDNKFVAFLNFLAKKVQFSYMKRHRKSEIITDTFLAFYTDKTEKKILRSYNETVSKYEI